LTEVQIIDGSTSNPSHSNYSSLMDGSREGAEHLLRYTQFTF